MGGTCGVNGGGVGGGEWPVGATSSSAVGAAAGEGADGAGEEGLGVLSMGLSAASSCASWDSISVTTSCSSSCDEVIGADFFVEERAFLVSAGSGAYTVALGGAGSGAAVREVPEERRADRFLLWLLYGGLMIEEVDPLNASRRKLGFTEVNKHFGAGHGVDVVLWGRGHVGGQGNVGVFARVFGPRVGLPSARSAASLLALPLFLCERFGG